jgi:hypothetical protein
MYGTERKGIRSYPWKVIYDVMTTQTAVFDLREDPAESQDRIDTLEPKQLHALESMLFSVMLGTTDTWYVEMGSDGGDRMFELRVSTAGSPVPARIYLHKILDAAGRLAEPGQAVVTEATQSELRVRHQGRGQSLVLAFKVEPVQVPVEFSFSIDGKGASDRTFLGPELSQAPQMPFTHRGGRAAAGLRGTPVRRPEAPYVLVWQSRSRFGKKAKVTLNERTREDLKALGYIQ